MTNTENFVEQVKQKVDSTIVNAYKVNPVMKDAIVRLVIVETARHLKPMKHKNPPRDKFDEGADAARSCMTYDCDDLIKQAEGK